MFPCSLKPLGGPHLDIEYQNAYLWGLWGEGGCERTPCTPPGYGPDHTVYMAGKELSVFKL